jgi:hypothetical protein
MRPIIIATGILFSIGAATAVTGAATAVECRPSAAASDRDHWAWRQIDNKKCWYAGRPGMEKSRLHWPANAGPVRAPPAEPQTVRSPSKPVPWSTFGMGPALPAGDTDFDARWPRAESESAPASIVVESDAVGTESQGPPLVLALVGALVSVLLTLFTLAAWSFWSGKRRRLPASRFDRSRMVHLPSPAPALVPAQPMVQSQYSQTSPAYIPRSARRERAAESSRSMAAPRHSRRDGSESILWLPQARGRLRGIAPAD